MRERVNRLAAAHDLETARQAVADVAALLRLGGGTVGEQRQVVRHLVLNQGLATAASIPATIDAFLAHLPIHQWGPAFHEAVDQELPAVLVDLCADQWDVDHREALRLLPHEAAHTAAAAIEAIGLWLEGLQGSARCLRGMRAARVLADLYRVTATDERTWRRRPLPACCIDSERITELKAQGQIGELPEAYETRINQLQRIDLRRSLAALGDTTAAPTPMCADDYGRTFVMVAPLRLGISSANASDNHLRSKERGAKTLNAGIALQTAAACAPPLRVTVRRLAEPKLTLRALSMDFQAEFEATSKGDAAAQSGLFFAYRRGGDEALRLVKQALVHTGIVRDGSGDVLSDIAAFTGGGGLEITTQSQVLQGSGLGTSSILAATILKALYRLSRNPWGETEHEYPALYDQSLLLEQSIGLNSGWQDARGACGGPSAVKNFVAPPTEGLPAPERCFLASVDEDRFTEHVVLFDTGVARAATRGLNVVLDAYLTRDGQRYPAIGESWTLHDEMVAALQAGDYSSLGRLATRYWHLRCVLDPDATNPALQRMFEGADLRAVSDGGLITGAGGGGFALLVAKTGLADELRARLGRLRQESAYARSRVVAYRLDRLGIRLAD
jgi:galactokinase/mevalonate kinase-like predicted kinase